MNLDHKPLGYSGLKTAYLYTGGPCLLEWLGTKKFPNNRKPDDCGTTTNTQ